MYQPVDFMTLQPEVRTARVGGFSLSFPTVKCHTELGLEQKSVTSLMYEAFHGLYNVEDENILHLDGDLFNHSVANMMLCEKSDRLPFLQGIWRQQHREGIPASQQDRLRSLAAQGKSACVTEYSLSGERLRVFPNLFQACRSSGLRRSELRGIISGNLVWRGYDRIFKMGHGPYFVDTHLLRKGFYGFEGVQPGIEGQQVLKYSTSGRLCGIYNNIYEASLANRVELNVLHQLVGSDVVLNDHVWFLNESLN